VRHLVVVILIALHCSTAAIAQQIVPESPPPAEAVAKALAADWLTDDERKDLRIFHGVWDSRDLDTPERAAQAALLTWSLDDPSLSDARLSAAVRADALVRRGRFQDAIALVAAESSPLGIAVRCEALAWLGKNADALAAAKSLDALLDEGGATSAADIVAASRAALVRARLEPRSTDDIQRVLNALARARTEFDRLYWPALLTEGQLLAEKHHLPAGVPALQQAIALQPRSSEAWYLLGTLAVEELDFDGSERAIKALDHIHTNHPLARLLEAQLDLRRRDPERAGTILDRLITAGSSDPRVFAFRAAAAATRFDIDGSKRWLARLDELVPGHPIGPYVVGAALSEARQYDEAAAALEIAIARAPAWCDPRIALGLLETQTGRDEKARAVLSAAIKLDPFEARAQFYLLLLDELAGYARIEGKHFIVRYQPGKDAAVALGMVEALDAMHEVVTGRFEHVPSQKTVIDLMPDHPKFAVRITGLPQLHTIAACMGSVIAIEVPKEGARTKHFGTFDWLKVLRHEYTHTVTLSQTKNRIPHWLTEAAAVSMEDTPRDYPTCQLLAREIETGGLFTLETINWGFIRPQRPQDRQLAYAQGHWMVQFMNERFGESALVRLLNLYASGTTEEKAMPEALGVPRAEFQKQFFEWATQQVKSWGLAPEPSMAALVKERRDADPDLASAYRDALDSALGETAERAAAQIGRPGDRARDGLVGREWPKPRAATLPPDDAMIAGWLQAHPDHPDVLELRIRRRLRDAGDGTPAPEVLDLLERYARARPVDPYPHRPLAKMYLASDEPAKAIPHLAELDIREEKENAYSVELARLKRASGDIFGAMASIERAARMNPYDPALRELAAAIAVEAMDFHRARLHVEALTILEPGAAQHKKRLERIDALISDRS